MRQEILPITYKEIMDKEDFNSLLGLYVNYWLIVLVKQGNITLKIGFDVFTLRENYVSILSK
ncbi:MAG: hypothetical protein IJ180_11970, partial [Bacteroidales bacterium]|nr:hypothetical protein [Bacteroidales bacterium]